MKRMIAACLSIALLLTLAACGGSADPASSTPPAEQSPNVETPAQPESLSEQEIKMMYSDPTSYVGSTVELGGQIFTTVHYTEKDLFFQMWADPENIDLNTIVIFLNPELQLEYGDYVKLTGEVIDVYDGEDTTGARVIAPYILASEIEVSSYKDIVMPTIASAAAAAPTIDQLGYEVTVEAVELAEQETRVYISIQNNGTNEFSLYGFNAVLIQGSTQYEEQPNYTANYPQPQSEIRPGIKTEGVIVFPAISAEPFQLILEGRSSDWHEDIDEYVYDCTITDQITPAPELTQEVVFNATVDEVISVLAENVQGKASVSPLDITPVTQPQEPSGDFVAGQSYSYVLSDGVTLFVTDSDQSHKVQNISLIASIDKLTADTQSDLAYYQAALIAMFEPDPSTLQTVYEELNITTASYSESNFYLSSGTIAEYMYAITDALTMLTIDPN